MNYRNAGKIEILTPMNKELMLQGRRLLDKDYSHFVGENKKTDWKAFDKVNYFLNGMQNAKY